MSLMDVDDPNVIRILETKNFYEILEIPKNASDEQIKSAHKRLALLVHPDKNNSPRAKDAFCVVRNATAVLLDKNKRQEYDDWLHSPRGVCSDKFNLTDDAIDAILTTGAIVGVVGVAAGLVLLYDWLTGSKKQKEREPKYAR